VNAVLSRFLHKKYYLNGASLKLCKQKSEMKCGDFLCKTQKGLTLKALCVGLREQPQLCGLFLFFVIGLE
jgi:hypothetical protein